MDTAKIKRIRNVAECFLQGYQCREDYDIRFDIISIMADRKKLERISKRDSNIQRLVYLYENYSTIENVVDVF